MSRDEELLLTLAARIADGAVIDWAEHLEAMDDADEEGRAAAGLRRLAAVLARFHQGEDDPRTPASGEPRSPWRWGRLQVGELLGSGTFGEVYRAYDPVLRRDVALKLRTRPRATALESTFLTEAQRLARVRHPNILAVHGADVHDGRTGLWADLLEGRTLEQSLEQALPFSRRDVLEIAVQMAEALAAVHGAGLVHGDVKASNVMRTPDGRIVLMDFGAGSDAEAGGGAPPAAGSPLSLAPELFAGRPATAASDLYSYGVLLYRLLTGRYPLEAADVEELAARHTQGWTPSWSRKNRPPRSLRRLIERLLAPDPGIRPTALQALEALRAVEEEPRRRRLRLAVAAVVTSLLVAFGASTAGWLSAKRSAERAEEARGEAEATAEFLTNLLLAPDITQQGPDVKVLDAMDEARSLADETLTDRPLIRGRILWLVARVKTSLGQGDEALAIFQESEDTFSELTGERARRERTEVMLRRARLLVERAELDSADSLLQEIEAEVRELTPGSPLRIEWMRTRAYLLTQRGQLAEAEAVFRQALDAGMKTEGDEELLQVIRLELAIVLQKQGKMRDAEDEYRRYLDWNLAEKGERHENTLIVRYNLACVVAEAGRYQEAESLFRKNVETARDWLGPGHRLRLLSLTGLAEALSDEGRLQEANELDEEIFPLAENLWGPDHPRTQILKTNTAGRRILTGQYAEAEALLLPAIDRLEERLGRDASPALHARMSWVELLLETGRAPQAERVAAEAYERATTSLGEESLVTLGLAARLGRAEAALGRLDEGLPLLREALSRERQVLGEDHGETLATQAALARAEASSGHQDEARGLLCDAEARLRRTLGSEHPLTARIQEESQASGGCPPATP